MHKRLLPLGILLSLTCRVGLADAQLAPSAPAAPASAPAAPAGADTSNAKQEAGRRFERAIKLYEDSDYALALAEFERVYQLVPDYRVLYNIAQVSEQLGRYARALTVFQEYLSAGAGELPAGREHEVNGELSSLMLRTARLDAELSPSNAEVVLDDKVLAAPAVGSGWYVDVGAHHVQVRAPGYREQSADYNWAGGDHLTIKFKLEPEARAAVAVIAPSTAQQSAQQSAQPRAPVSHTSKRWLGWAATGVLVVGALTLEVVGAQQASTLERERTSPGASPAVLAATRSRAKGYLVAADIVGGAALATGALTLYFELSAPSTKEHAAPQSASARLSLGAGSVLLDGRF
ncbi:MAG: hypothetical protein ABI335_19660 [Polyangiaceae bacterium]